MVGGNLSLVDQLSGMQLVSCQIFDETQQSFVWKRLKCLYRLPHVYTLSVIFLITDIKDGFFKNLKIISSKTIPGINSCNIILLCMVSYLWCHFHHKLISKCIIFLKILPAIFDLKRKFKGGFSFVTVNFPKRKIGLKKTQGLYKFNLILQKQRYSLLY